MRRDFTEVSRRFFDNLPRNEQMWRLEVLVRATYDQQIVLLRICEPWRKVEVLVKLPSAKRWTHWAWRGCIET